MIFVTVGTHEQQFDRLIKQIDILKLNGDLKDDVFIQSGYSNYEPRACKFRKFISSTDMDQCARDARIIVTHGGPGSIFIAYKYGKIPIVVPRQPEFGEHVDKHQMNFASFLGSKCSIICVFDIEDIREKLVNYDSIVNNLHINESGRSTEKFIERLNIVVRELFRR